MFVLKWQCIHLPSHLINSSRSSSVLCLCLQVVFEIVHYLERYYSTQASEADHLLGPFGQVAEHSSKRHQRSDPEQPLDSYEQVTQPSSAAWSSATGSPAQTAHSDWTISGLLCTTKRCTPPSTHSPPWPVHLSSPLRLISLWKAVQNMQASHGAWSPGWIKNHVKPDSDWPISGLDRTGHTQLSNNIRSSMTGSWAQLFQTD